MEIKEKLKALENAKLKLKEEFVGIDDIIDQVIDNVSSWYLTPEILERPQIVSLWGLTGTGKTSMVRKLINDLGYSNKSIFFDCGEESNNSSYGISNKISEYLDNMDEYAFIGNFNQFSDKDELIKLEINENNNYFNNFIFVFDEFQYSRTIDKVGEEIDKPNHRAIWNLLDHGLLDLHSYDYSLSKFFDTVSDIKFLANTLPELEIKSLKIVQDISSLPINIKKYLEIIKSYSYKLNTSSSCDEENESLVLISEDVVKFLYKRLTLISEKFSNVIEQLYNCTKIIDLYNLLDYYNKIISKPKILNCNKSLIFILGNLDEAYDIHSDIDPDIDADIYREIVDSVGIIEVKKALQSLFRSEQVGRLGNSIIRYPSLKKGDFKKIIDKELDRISLKFYNEYKISITFTENIKNLIYYEGVYPTQGVRPIFTTINYIILPKLSNILLEITDDIKKVIIDTENNFFNKEEVIITLNFVDINDNICNVIKKIQKLDLGQHRTIKNSEKIYIQSIHEASHSVIYSKLTGNCPSFIVSKSVDGGGYMEKNVKEDKNTGIRSYEEMENDIIVSLAGYYGEKEFFESSKCLLGSSSDLENIWDNLSSSIYKCGYFDAIPFTTTGMGNLSKYDSCFGIPDDKSFVFKENMTVQEKTLELLKNFQKLTIKYIKEEKELILNVAKYLSKNRCMTENQFKRYIKKYAQTFSLSSMKKLKEYNKNYYKNILKK